MQTTRRQPVRSPLGRLILGAGVLGVVLGAVGFGVAQQTPDQAAGVSSSSSADEPAVGRAQDYEVLRKLLGVPAPPPPEPEPEPEPEPTVDAPTAPPPAAAPRPARPKARPAIQRPSPRPSPSPKPAAIAPSDPAADEKEPVPAPRTKKPPVPVVPPAPSAPRRVDDAAPAMDEAPSATVIDPTAPTSASSEPGEAAEPATAAPSDDGSGVAQEDLPATGDVLRAGDFERWSHLLGPSAQWTLLRGAAIRVGETKPIAMEKARAAATQRYHAQVELTEDRRDMRNFVAGIPFPFVRDDEEDAGIKIVLNQQSRLIVDDVDARKMGCHLARIGSEGLELERTFLVGHWRRLFYHGRLYHEPKPTWENQEGIRYREMQYPLIEPFDLKGGGWNYIRYADVGRPDDGWLYYPITRRVRRLSTAQRSQGFFGQDMDLDSATGYAGNPAWMDWRLVGHKTMLASMHSENVPVKWQAAPADFAADEPWEPRDVYVLEGRSLLKEYAFARRVVYVDSESWLIAYSEIYDNQGKLWKALHQSWGFGSKVREDAGGATFEEFYLPGYAMIDMQIDHITRCELPLRSAVGSKGWFYNYSEAEGTTESAFDIVSLIGQNH